MNSIKLITFFLGILFSNEILSQSKTTYKYDAMQRIIRVDFQAGGFETYTYDKVGNRKSFIKVVPIDTPPPPPPPSSIQSTSQDVFKIYPNPTDGVFSLEGTLVSPSDAVLNIYDPSGKEILSRSVPRSSLLKQELDIRKYSAGNYVLIILYEDKKRSWTINKQ